MMTPSIILEEWFKTVPRQQGPGLYYRKDTFGYRVWSGVEIYDVSIFDLEIVVERDADYSAMPYAIETFYLTEPDWHIRLARFIGISLLET